MGVPQHPRHAFAIWVFLMEFRGLLFGGDFMVRRPEEVARAEADDVAFSEFESEGFFGNTLNSGGLTDALVDR